ncbi:MAG TPA: 3-oxoacyl-ACP reductase FabG [Alphaproteobacteria bacterium]|nr:3-oxoacyl-ACP reductase FabG [Alphaproteobacteria bacterium]
MADGPSGELAGRVALVTGAGRNIGRAIALALAEGGASIVVNTRRKGAEADAVAQEINAGGGAALAHLADVTDAEAVKRMVNAAIARFGRLDILVNNAAVRRETPIDRMTLADWREILAVVLDGAFNCVMTSLPHLRASGAGTIVNIGGLTAHTGAKDRAHVVTAKAGLVGFTRALAHDLAGDGITVNCVAPGLIATVRGAASAPQPHHHTINVTLVGRRGVPEEVAAMVRYLCGPGGRYITGQTMHVNGGTYLGG